MLPVVAVDSDQREWPWLADCPAVYRWMRPPSIGPELPQYVADHCPTVSLLEVTTPWHLEGTIEVALGPSVTRVRFGGRCVVGPTTAHLHVDIREVSLC